MKSSRACWSLCLVSALSVISLAAAPSAEAATYTYTLTGGFSGFITTTCDNCALNSSSITAWSISAGGFNVSSTTPGAQLTVPSGDTDLQATPNGITFSFAGPFGALTFSTPAASIVMTDDENGNSGFGPGVGAIEGCTPAGGCTFLAEGLVSETLSTQPIPFSGTITYKFTGTVLAATGIYAAAANAVNVTGTYTFDLDAGDGALPVSFSAPWTSVSGSETRPRVFGSTLASGSVTFSGASSVSYNTSVAGAALTGATLPSEYFADDREFSSATDLVTHSIQLVGGVGAKAPYDANGLPVIANNTTGGRGTLTAYANGGFIVGQLSYGIDTIEPVITTVAFSPSTLNFPTLPVGSISAPMTTLLKNTGDTPLTINGFGQGVPGPFEPVEYKCGAVLAAHASCSLSFSFAPSSAGTQEGTFVVDDSAVGSPTTLTLIGTGTSVPVVTLSAVVLQFLSEQVGTASVAQAVNVYNNLTRPLNISSVSITGAQANNFVLKNACPTSLPAGRSCAIFATFKPLIVGRLSAILSIVDDDIGSQQTVGLDGTSTAVPAPVAKLITTSLSFVNEPVGASSTARAVTISNTGNAPLTFSSVSIDGAQANEFALQDSCVSSLPAGRSCSLFVTFKPLIAGAATASLSIVDNATGSPQLVPLTGSATTMPEPAAKLSTTLLSFPNTPAGTASAEKAVLLTNTGTAALNISSVSLGGFYPNNYSLRNACVQSLPAGHNCVLFVTFKPQSAGTLQATLSIVDNATGSTQSVTLTGTGT